MKRPFKIVRPDRAPGTGHRNPEALNHPPAPDPDTSAGGSTASPGKLFQFLTTLTLTYPPISNLNLRCLTLRPHGWCRGPACRRARALCGLSCRAGVCLLVPGRLSARNLYTWTSMCIVLMVPQPWYKGLRDLSRQGWPHSCPETIDMFSMFPFAVRKNILVPSKSRLKFGLVCSLVRRD